MSLRLHHANRIVDAVLETGVFEDQWGIDEGYRSDVERRRGQINTMEFQRQRLTVTPVCLGQIVSVNVDTDSRRSGPEPVDRSLDHGIGDTNRYLAAILAQFSKLVRVAGLPAQIDPLRSSL